MMEANLHALLAGICPSVYPDVAEEGAGVPFVVYQGLGGEPINTVSNDPADKRNTYMQIAVWSTTRLLTLELIRQVEDAMRASSSFAAISMGEPLSTYESDTKLYGSIQRFSIWSSR